MLRMIDAPADDVVTQGGGHRHAWRRRRDQRRPPEQTWEQASTPDPRWHCGPGRRAHAGHEGPRVRRSSTCLPAARSSPYGDHRRLRSLIPSITKKPPEPDAFATDEPASTTSRPCSDKTHRRGDVLRFCGDDLMFRQWVTKVVTGTPARFMVRDVDNVDRRDD